MPRQDSKQPLRAAVIGTGRISEEHLRFLSSSDQAYLVAVCDLSPSLARYTAARFGIQRVFNDHARMLREAKAEVVHVLTPPQTHKRLVTDCLEADAHVIVEKPITPTNADFRELWLLADTRGRRLIEDQNYRFNEPFLAIERLVEEGRLGEVREAEVRLSLDLQKPGGRYADANLPHPSHALPAGVIHEFITHLCYLTLRFLPRFDRVAVAWSNHGGGDLFKYDDLDAVIIGGPVHGRIRFTCHTWPECFTITVRGTKGTVETDLFHPYLRTVVPRRGVAKLTPFVNQFINGLGLSWASVVGLKNKILQKTPLEGLSKFLALTYEALRNGSEPPVSYQDMDRASRLIEELLNGAHRI